MRGVEIKKMIGSIQSVSGFQNLQHNRSKSGSRHSNGNSLATELRKKRNRLSVSVENRNRCVEYSTQRIESVRVGRLREAKGGEGCLHPRGGIAQQVKILYRATRVADLKLNTIARKYPSVLPCKVVVLGSLQRSSDYQVTGWQGIDQAISDE